MRGASACFGCVAFLVQACASNYVTNDGADAADAGAKDVRSDRGSDAKDARTPLDARDAEGGDGHGDAGACTPILVKPIPAHGAGACPPDSSSPEAGSCSPVDVTSFSPKSVSAYPGTPHSGACTTANITDLFAACAGSSGNAVACSSFMSAHTTCVECALTPLTGTAYGPTLSTGGFAEVNVGTCIALAEPCNRECGDAVLAQLECQFQACDPAAGGNCAAANPSGDLACFAAALGCGCNAFATVASACTAELQVAPDEHPAASLCLGSSTESFQDNFVRIVDYFCGS
jgi:hypothetical protein